MFHALGDPERLRLLARLASGERCVTELAEMEGQKLTTVSNRLKRLLDAGLLARRRDAKHMIYRVADDNLQQLVDNALAHSTEITPGTSPALYRLRSIQ
ncbi:metalloregulator ArsR/SmtB family transcription factor [uncultured Salinisphaera sp.]|uniref:ArsR/SmtB family transcription factor n=1 Tax=uncultured Salinisphaera sp. TaxID=359372 RepID=UPI0032B234F9|tara:strand:+ start:3305 stop:3601 length:297 start_codon:yes stop_codon:yes gene_type:complete